MAQGNEFESLTIAVFTGKANPALAQEITRHLHVPSGPELTWDASATAK